MKMEKITFNRDRNIAKIASVFVIMLFSILSSSLYAQCPLGCNNKVQVSLGSSCDTEITPEMILEGEGVGCPYSVQVLGPNDVPLGSSVNADHIGMTLKVRVTLDGSNNSCWGYIVIEDKQPPVIDCPDTLRVNCYFFGNIPLPTATDNCDNNVPVRIVSDQITDLDCDDVDSLSAIRYIKYIATDKYGNESPICTRVIEYMRIGLDSVWFPDNHDDIESFILEACGSRILPNINVPITANNWDIDGDNYPDPWVDFDNDGQFDPGETESGIPTTTDGYPIFPNRSYCEINATFHDKVIPICEKSFKVLRNWTILDWCTTEIRDSFQIIKVLDTTAPQPSAPLDGTIMGYADPYDCEADVEIKAPNILTPDCTKLDYTIDFLLADNSGVAPPGGLYQSKVGNTEVVKINIAKDGFDYYYEIRNLPLGRVWIRYTVVDACGNSNLAFTEARVIDHVPPIPVCDEFTVVTLTTSGYAKVFALTFDDGSHDNCTDVSFQVRRLDENGNPDGTCSLDNRIFRDFVEFCCADVGQQFMVELKVWDDGNGSGVFGDEVNIYEDTNGNGILGDFFEGIQDILLGTESDNYNTCMVLTTVQDKIDPIITCPPNITVSCEIDLDDLEIFGDVVEDKDDRENIVIPGSVFVNADGPLIDGYAMDNCDVTVNIDEPDPFLNSCRVGAFNRVFVATDGGGRTASCTQRITVNPKNFDGNINWPDDITIDGCQDAGTDPEDLAEFNTSSRNYDYPLYTENICTNMAKTYKDQVFNFVDGVCFKILRKWTVIDWCEYERSQRTRGIWTHTQIIKVIDEDAPVVETTNNQEFCTYGPGCGGEIDLANGATDCTPDENLDWRYEIDLFDDGIDITTGTGNDASGYYVIGSHRITWFVEDMCGNQSEETYLFLVKDCKKPTPYCISEITTVVMPTTGDVTIWARDFNRGAEDNCPGPLRFSFVEPNSNATNLDSSKTFTCPVDAGQQELNVYVVDQANNWDYCTVTITIQVNHDCGGSNTGATAAVSGNIATAINTSVDQVMVSLENMDSHNMSYFETHKDGTYAFSEMTSNFDYMVRADKNDDVLNGVSTLDIVMIQRHLLGLQEFNDPYKVIAADINNNKSLAASDLIQLRKVILGIYDEFPDNRSWKFIDAKQDFNDVDRPWDYTEEILIEDLSTNDADNNFVGVKVGDVNNDAISNARGNRSTVRSNNTITLAVGDQSFTEGQVVEVNVTASEMTNLLGYQMTLGYNTSDLEFVKVSSGLLEINDSNLGLTQPGLIAMSWNDINTVSINPRENMFTLTFRAKTNSTISENLDINSLITKSEAYTSDLEIANLELTFTEIEATEVILLQNRPNPFSESTVISFVLPKASSATLTVFDITGKLLQKVTGNYPSGKNNIEVNAEMITADGILYYQLESGSFKSTKKMIKINR